MADIRCPKCGENDPEHLIIFPDGKRLVCDRCGWVFNNLYPEDEEEEREEKEDACGISACSY
jgi:hypothetical protein